MQEKVNKELEPSELRVRMKSSPEMKALGAYSMLYAIKWDNGEEYCRKFDPNNLEWQEWTTKFPSVKDFRQMKEKEVHFTLKYRTMMIKRIWDEKDLKLTGLATRSVLQK